MIEILTIFLLMLGGALTTLAIIHIFNTISDSWVFKKMLPAYLIVLFIGIGCIIVGYLL